MRSAGVGWGCGGGRYRSRKKVEVEVCIVKPEGGRERDARAPWHFAASTAYQLPRPYCPRLTGVATPDGLEVAN